MCVHDSADLLKLLVKPRVCRCIGGRVHRALHFVAVKIDDYHILGFEVFIRNSAGLDHKELLLPVDSADVAPFKYFVKTQMYYRQERKGMF